MKAPTCGQQVTYIWRAVQLLQHACSATANNSYVEVLGYIPPLMQSTGT
jgi:hypothetical protein